MTTARPADPPAASAPARPKPFRLPDVPEKHPDDMTSVDSLHRHGAIPNFIDYLGNPETTIVSAEHYIVPGPAFDRNESRYPDLLVAFDVAPADYEASNGYVVSEQGKPPDFVLEVASRSTASDDLGVKKNYYEGIGVGEYWLFDGKGEFYGFTLRGYRLTADGYELIPVDEIAPGVFQGYSAALNVILRVEDSYLGWHDPDTEEHIPTKTSETAARLRAEARVAELEAEIHRLRRGR